MTLGAIPYTVVSLAVVGLVLIIGGFIMETLVNVNNDLMASPDLPTSPMRANTMNVVALAFKAMGIVAIITSVLFLVMNGAQQPSGEI